MPTSNPTIVEAVEAGNKFANSVEKKSFLERLRDSIASYITWDVIATKSTWETHSVEILTELHWLEPEELWKILEEDRNNAFNKKN